MTTHEAIWQIGGPEDYSSNGIPAFTWDSISVYSSFQFSKLVERRTPHGVSIEAMEAIAFSNLSEDSFAEDWNSPEDAIYDNL